MSNTSADTATVAVTQNVGTVAGGKVTGIEVASQVADTITNQSLVDLRVITNNIILLNDPQMLDAVVAKLTAALGVDKTMLQSPQTVTIESHVSQQIAEVAAAQKDVAAHGLAVSAQSLYDLGMLMAYRRDLDAALDYFRQAARAQPDFADAHEAIAWLQQSRANSDLAAGDGVTAMQRLDEARAAVAHANQSDARVMALSGYIAQHAAVAAQMLQHTAEAHRFRTEAIGAFELAAQQFPDDPSVLNGMAGVYAQMGNYTAAIRVYERVIGMMADYAAAHNDLALAYEGQMDADPAHARRWCEQAIETWKAFLRIAPNDPTMADVYVARIRQHVLELEDDCASLKRPKNAQRKTSPPSTPRKKSSTKKLKTSARSK